jgi:hypothetical protein
MALENITPENAPKPKRTMRMTRSLLKRGRNSLFFTTKIATIIPGTIGASKCEPSARTLTCIIKITHTAHKTEISEKCGDGSSGFFWKILFKNITIIIRIALIGR